MANQISLDCAIWAGSVETGCSAPGGPEGSAVPRPGGLYGQYNYLVYMGCNWDYQSNLTRRYDGWHSAWDQRFSYDRLDRLYDGEQGPYQGTPNATWEWDDNTVGGPDYLDKLGNWVNFNNTGTLDERNHNAVNEIDSREVSSSSRIVTYDAAGNLATLQAAAGTAGQRFTHDFRNRLIEVEETDDITAGTPDWSPVATYTYDGLNRRAKKVLDNGPDTLYTYNGWQCVEERNAASPGTILRRYIYGGRYIDEPVCKVEDPGGTPVKHYYLHDANYNVVALTNASGSVLERYNYEPYGRLTITDASYSPRAATLYDNTLTFQGRRWDDESSLYYFRNRMYNAELGRFVQRDPAGYVDGGDVYEFLRARPVSFCDPSGLTVTCPGGAWWFSGTVTGGHLFFVGYVNTSVKFECKKKLLVGRRHWCCENGSVVEFTQDVYKVPVAIGTMRSGRVGLGLGGMVQGILGSVTGKPTSDDLAGNAWAGGTASATVIVVGGAASKSPSSESLRGGIATGAGLGASITTGWTWTTIYASFMETQEQGGLSAYDAKFRIIKLKLQCKTRYETIDPPEEVDHLGPGGGLFE